MVCRCAENIKLLAEAEGGGPQVVVCGLVSDKHSTAIVPHARLFPLISESIFPI